MGESRVVMGDHPGEAVDILRWTKSHAGLSDATLGRLLGYKATTVQMYREGRRPNPGMTFMSRWVRACGFRVVVVEDDE